MAMAMTMAKDETNTVFQWRLDVLMRNHTHTSPSSSVFISSFSDYFRSTSHFSRPAPHLLSQISACDLPGHIAARSSQDQSHC
jgi:hypothetical protein